MSGILYVVATPIGNLEDITLRALRILKESSVVAAEDTRHTRKLLSHFDIHTPMVSFHDHSSETERARLVARLLDGQNVALVTDAGTPGVSDPGFALIADAVAAGVVVTPIPGASAVLTALVGSGLAMDQFRFVGFLPRKAGDRKRILDGLKHAQETLIFYEAPHRLAKMLADLATAFGDRPACAARELTKIHEEFIRGSLPEIISRLPEPLRGEWTIVVGGAFESVAQPVEEAPLDWRADLQNRLDSGESLRDAARAVAMEHSMNRKEVYAAGLGMRTDG